MLYGALAFLVIGVTVWVLGFFGVVRGAAGFSNAALLLSVACLLAVGISRIRRRTLPH